MILDWHSHRSMANGAERAGALVAALLAVCICGASARAQTLAELASYSGPDRSARLVAGAKREGTVTLYSSATLADQSAIVGAFQAKYGIKVQQWRGSSEDIRNRALTEYAGGRFDVDVAETAGPDMEAMVREQLMQPVTTPVTAQLIPQATMPHHGWVATRLSVFVGAYNTNIIKPADAPKSYEDLRNPKWKGKLGIDGEDSVWFGALIAALGEERGVKFFRELVRTNGLSVRRGHTLLANLVVSGEVPFALSAYQYKIEQLRKSGAPIEWYVIPPGISRFLGTGVMRRAPHPNAAILFLDFMLSDAQALLLDREFTPTNMKVKPLDIPFKVIDPAQMLDEGDKWAKLFDAIVVKQGKQ